MKKLSFNLLIALMTLHVFAFVSCKKDNTKNTCGYDDNNGGVGATIFAKPVILWTDKSSYGAIQLVSITNKSTGKVIDYNTEDYMITKMYSSQPDCGADGIIKIELMQGYSYTYKARPVYGSEFTGEIKTDCTMDCQAVVIH